MLTGNKRIFLKISAILLIMSILTTTFCFNVFAEPDDGSSDEPTSYHESSASNTTTSAATSTPSSKTSTSTQSSSREPDSSGYHQTTSTQQSSSKNSQTSNPSTSKNATSTILFDYTDDGNTNASWGTDFSEGDTTSAVSDNSSSKIERKEIADYYTKMKSLLWLPILLIILSAGTLIFVNVNAYRKNRAGRNNRKGRGRRR